MGASAITILPSVDNATEHLVVALFFALLIHLFLLFGIGFNLEQNNQRMNTRMDIILVQSQSKKAPEDAKYLAQANLDGGGNEQQEERATTPTRAEFPAPTPEMTSAASQPQLAAQSAPPVLEQLTAEQAKDKIALVTPKEDVKQPQETPGQDLQTTPPTTGINQTELIIKFQKEIASIQADLDSEYRKHKNRPPHKYITAARAKTSHYARYMHVWRLKIEELGEQHFPEMALKNRISGSIMIDLAINPNGTIHKIEILEGSKSTVLDDAAVEIARMASPYQPLTRAIKKEIGANGILHIISTWKFDIYGGFSSH
ncbi:energy transducer TonB [Candidatus Venteria ishoeyi]|uniref:Gram-negative bacterial tonB protein n=1 Tax=Candidatus Venteria ishoeyi TaxID=1899563 RepID=A0A1H6FGW0_9GAMM|nr:TonB family protein [Candidatus Venteria ishoeyi]SEH08234.1 Gram-negative bacterial tonB protein [Candidatus Venteria ishoeyi]